MLSRRQLNGHFSLPCGFLMMVVFLLFYGFVFRLPVELSDESSMMFNESSAYILLGSHNNWSLLQPYSLSELPTNDPTTLIDIKDFEFTMNHDPCNESQLFLLILIHSAPGNSKKRQVVRETWGKQTRKGRVLFLVGQSDEFQTELIEENKKNQDIIQGNFIDSYRNITYKHVMAMKWAIYYCESVKYVLKLDDDVFVHVPALMNFLKHDLSPWGAKGLILCDPAMTRIVKRSWRSKWRVSPRDYPRRLYPPYCEGYIILYSLDSVFLLYREAQREPYFWIDDVHITGVLAEKINLSHSSLHSLILNDKEMMQILNEPNSHQEFLFGPKNLDEDRMIELYHWTIAVQH